MLKHFLTGLIIVITPSSFAIANDFNYAQRSVQHTVHNHVSILFLQQARHATLTHIKNPDQPCYRLQLAPRDRIIYFSNQPQRLAGTISDQQFMRLWVKNNIQPNMVLQGFSHKREFTMAFSALHANYQAKQRTFHYMVCLLKNSSIPRLHKLNNVTLFIDNFHGWPP